MRQQVCSFLSYQSADKTDQRFFHIESKLFAEQFFTGSFSFVCFNDIIMIVEIMICFRVPHICIDTIENADAFSFFVFEEGFQSIAVVAQFSQVTRANSCYFPGTLDAAGKRIDVLVPVEHAPLPGIPREEDNHLYPNPSSPGIARCE